MPPAFPVPSFSAHFQTTLAWRFPPHYLFSSYFASCWFLCEALSGILLLSILCSSRLRFGSHHRIEFIRPSRGSPACMGGSGLIRRSGAFWDWRLRVFSASPWRASPCLGNSCRKISSSRNSPGSDTPLPSLIPLNQLTLGLVFPKAQWFSPTD